MKRCRRTGAWMICLLVLLLCIPGCRRADGSENILLEFYFLDIGQGDSILLRTEAGDILIDAGPDDHEDRLCLRLHQLGVTELRLMILTHPDEDHIGGADGVLYEFPVAEIWIPDTDADHESVRLMRTAADGNGSVIRHPYAGEFCRFGETQIFLLAPFEGGEKLDANDSSIVCKIACGKVSALFTGDAEAKTEKRILAEYGAAHLRCDLYKVGHHGSSTSTTEELLEAMQPEYAVISAEAENSYGHPHGEVVKRLEDAGIRVFRTDRSGEIVFATDGERIWNCD